MAILVAAFMIQGPRILAASATPTIGIVAPSDGATVSRTFYVSFFVVNFTIRQPGQPGEVISNTTGHLHTFLDGNYYALWASPDAIPFINIQPGTHSFKLQVVHDDHTPFSPDISITRTVKVTDAPSGSPTLVILSPSGALTSSANVNNSFVVSFLLSNFMLANPVGQPNALNTGHIHVFVDGAYVTIWAQSDGVPLRLQAGSHTIKLQLVNNDHSALSPDVSKSITVNVLDSLSSAVNNAQNFASNAANWALIATVLALLSWLTTLYVVTKVRGIKSP